MNIAWFRPGGAPGFDDLGAVIDSLSEIHPVQRLDARAAHDFVWQQAHGVYDLCVYELDDTLAHQYIWPYVLHYPGVLALRSAALHPGRAWALVGQRRDADHAAEMAFADGPGRTDPPWPLVRGAWSTWRIPVLASRVTAVCDDAMAVAIAQACPGARISLTPTGVPDPRVNATAPPARADAPVRVLVSDDVSPGVTERAIARARAAGARVEPAHGRVTDAGALRDTDIVVATRWPTLGRPLLPALFAAAVGATIIVAETESTARWPSLDPQTWQPRAVRTGTGHAEKPIAVSIDPRDEEHSLMVALVRLAADAALRASLGQAARAWWERHATVAVAVASWRALLEGAVALPASPRPAGWPPHLDADGGSTMRAILDQFGISHS